MTNPTHFTAVTWNVLAPSYAHASRYPNSPPEALDETRRFELLLRRVRALEADVLCLQELEPAWFQRLEALALGSTHTGFLALKPGRPEGCAIFARKNRFEWLEHWTERFTVGDAAALASRLKFIGTDTELAVVSAHLNWEPDSVSPEAHRGLAQMQQLLTMRSRAPKARWLFAGDFNALSQSAVLARAYGNGMAESCRAQRPWDTCNINGRCRKIDYLLFSEGTLQPEPAPLPALRRETPLPSLTEPSDHLALTVRFTSP